MRVTILTTGQTGTLVATATSGTARTIVRLADGQIVRVHPLAVERTS